MALVSAAPLITGTEPSPFIGVLAGVRCAAQGIVDTRKNHIRAITAGMDFSATVDRELCVDPRVLDGQFL